MSTLIDMVKGRFAVQSHGHELRPVPDESTLAKRYEEMLQLDLPERERVARFDRLTEGAPTVRRTRPAR